MKQVLVSLVLLGFLGFMIGCTDAAKPPNTAKPVATPLSGSQDNLPGAPTGGKPIKK